MASILSVLVLTAGILSPPLTSSTPDLCAGVSDTVEEATFLRTIGVRAVCTVDCGELNSPVSCSGTTCTAVDRSCPGERGHVTCGTTTLTCPVCCTNGQIKFVITGPNCSCDGGTKTPRDRYLCVNGNWEFQYSTCGAPFCQGF